MVSRKVRFYEVLSESGEKLPGDIDWDDFLAAVLALPEKDAYVDIARMELLGSAFRPSSSGKRACPVLILDRITRDVRMRIENQRRYRPLELEDGDTIAEPTHFGLFPQNVVGVIRVGNHTPSFASFRDFINVSGILDDEVALRPLVDLNAARALGDVELLTRLDLEMDAAAASVVLPDEGRLSRLLRGFNDEFPGVSFEVSIKVGRSNHAASEAAFDEARRLVREGDRTGLRKARIGYKSIDTGRADTFDFLGEEIAKSVDVDLDESNSEVTDRSASEEIAKAYDSLYDDIQSALLGSPNLPVED